MKSKEDILLLKRQGDHIKHIRQSKGLSYRDVAARCRLEHSWIHAIENGSVNASTTTLIELAKGLDVHPKELFDFDYENTI